MAVTTVDEYIAQYADRVGKTLQAARRLILDTLPGVEEFMKWGTPTYRLPDGDPICYLYGGEDHVNLGFLFGAQLDDREGLLRGAGRKDSRHVPLTSAKELSNPAIAELLTDSAALAA